MDKHEKIAQPEMSDRKKKVTLRQKGGRIRKQAWKP